MQNVVAAATAIFVQFESVRVIALILTGSIVALLAGYASQVNNNSVLFSSHLARSLSLEALSKPSTEFYLIFKV